MSACFNPRRRHLFPESVSARRICPEPHCGFLLEGASIHKWRVAALLKSNEEMDLYAATSAREQGSQRKNMVVRVLRSTDQTLLPVLKPLQTLHHHTIHPVLAIEEIELSGPLYLLSPWEACGSLERVLRINVQISFASLARIVQQIAEALQIAHRQHIVHGHLKPENCLFTTHGTLSVCDFYHGLLGDAEKNFSTLFTAPEQFQGNTQPASDQFALAALAYMLLKQRSSLALEKTEGWSSNIASYSLLTPPDPLLTPSHPLDRVLRRALSQEPSERFPDISTFARFFYAALEQLKATDTQAEVGSGPTTFSSLLPNPSTTTASSAKKFSQPDNPAFPTRTPPASGTGDQHNQFPPERKQADSVPPSIVQQRRFPAQTYQNIQQESIHVQSPTSVVSSCLLPGHTAPISALSWERNGHALVSGSEDGEIHLWSFQGEIGRQGNLLQGHKGSVRALCWSPDSTLVTSASSDSALRIWDLTTPTDGPRPIAISWWGHSGDAAVLAWSPDAMTLASGGKDGILRFWNRRGEALTQQQAHSSKGIKSVAWSPDQKWIASGGADQTIRVWDTATHEQKASWQAHQDEVHHLQWSPHSQVLASAASKKDTRIYLWDTSTGQCLATITEHRREIVGLFWSPNSSWLASCSSDGLLHFWRTDRLLEKRSAAPLGPPITLSNMPLIMLGLPTSSMLAIATRSLSIEILKITSK